MSTLGYTVFDTAIGACGIAWSKRGIVRLLLPDESTSKTRARLAETFPEASEAEPSRAIRDAIAAIRKLLTGELEDLGRIALDMHGVPPFHRRVYEAARAIPAGSTETYGEVAGRVGSPGASRAVGQALGKNPFAIIVPCHRVLASGGKMGGFTAHGGVDTKRAMLTIERAEVVKAPPPKPKSVANSEAKSPSPAPTLFTGSTEPSFDAAKAIRHLRRVDSTLAQLIDAVGAFEMKQRETLSLFQALAESIVYQQLTGKAAATIQARVVALYPRGKEPNPKDLLKIPDASLRAAGLSGNKTLALRDLAERCVRGEVPTLETVHGMDDESVIAALTRVRGIGRWTAEMLLMFRLGRPDVLPVDDYGIRNGYAIAWMESELPKPKDLARLGAKWAPYRTVASWYLWRAVDRARAATEPVKAIPKKPKPKAKKVTAPKAAATSRR